MQQIVVRRRFANKQATTRFLAMAAAISQEFAEPIRQHDVSSLAGSSSSFRLGRSSSIRRVSSFGREVVIPALKRQGSATVSSSRSLYREAALMTQPSCFGSWRWTTTTTAATGGPESPTSKLLRNTDHGASAAPDSSSGSVLDEQARDARTAAVAFGRLLSSRSMSLLQSRSSGAWGKKSSRRESSAAAAAAQWTVATGRSAGEEIANLEPSMSFKPAPMWKRMLKKLRANAKRHMIIVHPVSAREWTNYDAQSYAKNFDNGERWRDDQTDSHSSSSSSSFFSMQSEEDSEEQEQLRHELGLRETALHTALLQKFHSTRYDSSSAALAAIDSFRATGASSMPVNPVRPYQPRQDIVPLWQRRNVRPPSKLQLTNR